MLVMSSITQGGMGIVTLGLWPCRLNFVPFDIMGTLSMCVWHEHEEGYSLKARSNIETELNCPFLKP